MKHIVGIAVVTTERSVDPEGIFVRSITLCLACGHGQAGSLSAISCSCRALEGCEQMRMAMFALFREDPILTPH